MPSLDMEGPYALRPEEIEDIVEFEAPGNFAIGHLVNNRFTVLYVGRSDKNLPQSLRDMVGRHRDFRLFKFSYATSAQAAFLKHCRNYHDFGRAGKLLNRKHPSNTARDPCPFCG